MNMKYYTNTEVVLMVGEYCRRGLCLLEVVGVVETTTDVNGMDLRAVPRNNDLGVVAFITTSNDPIEIDNLVAGVEYRLEQLVIEKKKRNL